MNDVRQDDGTELAAELAARLLQLVAALVLVVLVFSGCATAPPPPVQGTPVAGGWHFVGKGMTPNEGELQLRVADSVKCYAERLARPDLFRVGQGAQIIAFASEEPLRYPFDPARRPTAGYSHGAHIHVQWRPSTTGLDPNYLHVIQHEIGHVAYSLLGVSGVDEQHAHMKALGCAHAVVGDSP